MKLLYKSNFVSAFYMREDYSILVDVIHIRKPTEHKLLLPYLTYEKSLRDIADEQAL